MVIGGFAFRGRPGILEPSLSFFLLARLIQGAGVLGPTSLARRLVPLRRPGQCPERLCRRPDALPSIGIRRRRTCHRLLRLALCRFTNPLGGACLRLSHSFPGSGSGASDPRAEKKMSFWAHCSSDAAFRPAADDGLGPLRQKSVTIGTNRPLFRWTLSGVWSIGGSIPTPSYSLHEEDPERAKEALFCFPRKPNDRPSRISVREAVTSGVPPGGRPMTAIMARAASLQPASMIPRSGGWLGSFSAAPLAKRFRRGFYAGVALCRHGGVSLGVVKGSGKLEDGYFATACSGA